MDLLDNQWKYWDQVAETKSFSHPFDFSVFEPLVPLNSRILDFGCGYGRTLNTLWEKGYRDLVGVDSSKGMLQRGKKAFPHLTLKHFTMEELPWEKHSFDAVLLFAVLTCIPTDEGQRRLISHMTRLLSPKGILYISDLLLQEDERNRKRYEEHKGLLDLYGVFKLPEGGVFRHHSMDWIDSLFSSLEEIKTHRLELITMNGHHAAGFQRWCGKRR